MMNATSALIQVILIVAALVAFAPDNIGMNAMKMKSSRAGAIAWARREVSSVRLAAFLSAQREIPLSQTPQSLHSNDAAGHFDTNPRSEL
jgi:hypothetical protein